MQQLQKFIKNQKSLLNKLYRLYKTLPKELHSVEYKLVRGADWIQIMWFLGPDTSVDIHITNTGGTQRGVVGNHKHIHTFYLPEDLETALKEHIKLANS